MGTVRGGSSEYEFLSGAHGWPLRERQTEAQGAGSTVHRCAALGAGGEGGDMLLRPAGGAALLWRGPVLWMGARCFSRKATRKALTGAIGGFSWWLCVALCFFFFVVPALRAPVAPLDLGGWC
eukprot:COSAG02_NODE_36799_length_450_cov_0.886040_1_plen_122_part_01